MKVVGKRLPQRQITIDKHRYLGVWAQRDESWRVGFLTGANEFKAIFERSSCLPTYTAKPGKSGYAVEGQHVFYSMISRWKTSELVKNVFHTPVGFEWASSSN